MVLSQPRQKVREAPISTEKVGQSGLGLSFQLLCRIMIHSSLGKETRPYLQNNQGKKGVAQVVGCLPGKSKALS
jgi:hypothetical protein